MKTFLIVYQILLICLTGCSTTHLLRYEQTSFDRLNSDLEGEVGEIYFTDGWIIQAENIKLFEDSSCWVDLKSSEIKKTDTWNILQVTYKNNTRGLLEFAGYGALIGVTSGALLGWEIAANQPSGGFGPGELIVATAGSGFGLISGIVIGSVIGGLSGHREIYIIDWPK